MKQRLWRGWLKPVFGWLLFTGGIYRIFFRNRAIIVSFHSVVPGPEGDALRTPLRYFEDCIRFFCRYFEVIRLEDLLDRLARGEGISRCLVVSFDDGYADNAGLAADVLDAHGVSATFFITTGFIDSAHQAFWDKEDGVTSVWMTWNDVRALARRGHSIAAHTRSHADIGKLDDDQLCSEVVGSINDIQTCAGLQTRLFAMPFGRPSSLTPSVRALCEREAIRGCFSNAGGVVITGSPSIGLNRFPVDFSDAPSVYSAAVDMLVDCITVNRR